MSAQSIILFAGRRYYLDKEGYYRANSRTPDRDYLHQRVWKLAYGDIPPGHVIHHKVADLGTVDAADLECLTPREHNARHVEQLRKNMRVAQLNQRKVPLTCKRCGTAYLGQRGWYCSGKCKGIDHYYISQARRTGTRSTP